MGQPDENRYTWIKGDATFESLRQACIEPETRAVVEEHPPGGPLPYRTIERVRIDGAPWCIPPDIPLNPGLVAIIGARGSGKTALADIVATGALAQVGASGQSFVSRAASHLGNATVALSWAEGDPTASALLAELGEQGEPPKVQYLTQQFVERLCSADGLSDDLLAEIERVIFEAHPVEERMATTSFRELLDLRAARGRGIRTANEEADEETNRAVNAHRELIRALPDLKARLAREAGLLEADKSARSKLIIQGGEERAQQLEHVTAAIGVRQRQIELVRLREQALYTLKDKVSDERVRILPNRLSRLKVEHTAAGLTEPEWDKFALEYAGDVDATLQAGLRACQEELSRLLGTPVDPPPPPSGALVAEQESLDAVPLRTLEAEANRLRAQIGLDAQMASRVTTLTAKINAAGTALIKLRESITEAQGAQGRLQALIQQRSDQYAAIFDGIAAEAEELSSLYAPLQHTLAGSLGALGKLTFSVRRNVDIATWVAQGEALMDLRKVGKFRGHGQLRAEANTKLLSAWESGDRHEVAEAMASFRTDNDREILKHVPSDLNDPESYQAWGTKVAAWLTSTDHITVRYGVQYDGVDIEQLSPGTRGIVLLLLYLSIDRHDDRPLIIDQPEENLDPRSIYTELVDRFRETRTRRQIIIVTHNANLVVNTDAEQVIVAHGGPHRAGQLPEITYTCGGLENPTIRELVCEILEGGRTAFKDRARRLHMDLTSR